MIFEWEGISCAAAAPTQHQITRILMGKTHLWIITYSMHGEEVVGRDTLIANLKSAKVGTKAATRQ